MWWNTNRLAPGSGTVCLFAVMSSLQLLFNMCMELQVTQHIINANTEFLVLDSK